MNQPDWEDLFGTVWSIRHMWQHAICLLPVPYLSCLIIDSVHQGVNEQIASSFLYSITIARLPSLSRRQSLPLSVESGKRPLFPVAIPYLP